MDGAGVTAVVEAALVEHFGHLPTRACISFLGVEPIAVLRFEPIPGGRAYLTLGMSRHPMTGAAEPVVRADGPRAELMLHVRDDADDYRDVWRKLGILAAAPVVEGVVYVPGMSVDLGEALAPGSACTGGILEPSPLRAIETPAGPVVVLQVLPATPTELAWNRVHGSEALHKRWITFGIDLLDLGRKAVALG